MKTYELTFPKRIVAIYCSHCGSKNVRRDADAGWSESSQTWELVAVYDHAICEECGGKTTLKEREIIS